MKKIFLPAVIIVFFLLLPGYLFAQGQLTLDKIMQGERFTGYSPENPQWSPVGNLLYFTWRRNADSLPDLFVLKSGSRLPEKVSQADQKKLPSFYGSYNRNRSKMVYSKGGDLFLADLKTGKITRVTFTSAYESNPTFNMSEDKILYTVGNNWFSWDMKDGSYLQLTDIRSGKEKAEGQFAGNENDKALHNNQMYLFRTLAERKKRTDLDRKESKSMEPEVPKVIYTGQGQARSVKLSPDYNFLVWQSFQPVEQKRTVVPAYVTESGYTEDIPGRSKVGMPFSSSGDLNIYDMVRDSLYQVKTDDIPGIMDVPDYVSDYPGRKEAKPRKRNLSFRDPVWSDDGKSAVIDIYSEDNKDRWIMLLDIKNGNLKLLDRQHDSAWIGGPGIGYGQLGWLPDNRTIFFQSEETGYSHLYVLDISTGQKKALTSGTFEVYDLKLSIDKKLWYFISNEVDPGIRELYSMPVTGGSRTRITNFGGGVEYELSPDEKNIALRVSFANQPWELYIVENKNKAVPVRITESVTPEFRQYSWRMPEFINFKASDGIMVPARLYRPANRLKNGPAVIFVHGAGYLQNAHRWWSDYSHEYMFHNFLVDNGYTVLDIDYRGSAGYGRDWRTAIYRNMGGKDLDDQADGAGFLVSECQVNPDKIGIYGGSYGGFITLMAMFRKPGTFTAGAALRSVTDWAHYNHGYTSDILNTPVADSLAYARSSPIYYAEGLKGALLICHGMIDDNVHFQDVVRLVQRLIELGKDNWELAVYPLESHGFVEPSSWTDEYKRIFNLFEKNLK
jgi:dipeptidyl aminopeptidase/acylaminoacyl peptidase